MYELPSLDGRLTGEEVLHYLKEKGLSVVRISALPDAKHIFSHKEWHMSGYLIKADELEPYRGEWDGLIFAETAKTEEEYPIPAAFSAYAGYLGIRIGNQKYEGKGNSVKE